MGKEGLLAYGVVVGLAVSIAAAAAACVFDLDEVRSPGTGTGSGGSGAAVPTTTATHSGGGTATGTFTEPTTTSTSTTTEPISAYACQSCLTDKCVTALEQCNADTACAELHSCWMQCLGPIGGDRSCIFDCAESHQTAYVQMIDEIACWFDQCHAECLGSGCGVFGVGVTFWSGCLDCINDECGAQCALCESDPDCVRLGTCLWGCPFTVWGADCRDQCHERYGAGQATYDALWWDQASDAGTSGCGNQSCGSCFGS